MIIADVPIINMIFAAIGVYIFIFTRVKNYKKLFYSFLVALAITMGVGFFVMADLGYHLLWMYIILFLFFQIIFFMFFCFEDVIIRIDELMFFIELLLILYLSFALFSDLRFFFLLLVILPLFLYNIFNNKKLGTVFVLMAYTIHSMFVFAISFYQIFFIGDFGLLTWISIGFLASLGISSIISAGSFIAAKEKFDRDKYINTFLNKFSPKQYNPYFLIVTGMAVLAMVFLNHYFSFMPKATLINWLIIFSYFFASFKLREHIQN